MRSWQDWSNDTPSPQPCIACLLPPKSCSCFVFSQKCQEIALNSSPNNSEGFSFPQSSSPCTSPSYSKPQKQLPCPQSNLSVAITPEMDGSDIVIRMDGSDFSMGLWLLDGGRNYHHPDSEMEYEQSCVADFVYLNSCYCCWTRVNIKHLHLTPEYFF